MYRRTPFLLIASGFAACLIFPAFAQTQNPLTASQIPLPSGPPETGTQSPIPAPVQPLPPATKPLLTSPQLEAIKNYAAKNLITMDDAIAIALYTSTDMASAVASLEQARGQSGEARAQLNPTLGINSQLTYYGQGVFFNVGALIPGAKGSFTVVPQFNPINTAAFSLPIDLFGAIHSAVSQAQFNEVAARIDVNRVRNDLIARVKSAFYGVLRAQSQLAVQTDNLNVSLQRLTDAEKNYAAGTSPYFDVLSSQRDVATSQQAVVTAKGTVSSSLTTLKTTIGLDVESTVGISATGAVNYPKDVPPPPGGAIVGTQTMNQAPVPPGNNEQPMPAPNAQFQPVPLPPLDTVQDNFDFGPEYKSVLAEALNKRPELLESQARIAAAQRGVQYARRSELPSLSLGLQYINTPNAAGFTLKNQEAAVLGVNIPIWDGGLAAASVQAARSVIANAEVSERKAGDQVKSDVQQAYIALVQARDRVAVANAEVVEARESLRLARIRYNAGMTSPVAASPQLELINSQTSLTQAETDQVNALYDYNNARAQLDRAVGRYSYTGSQPGYPDATQAAAKSR